MLDDHTPGADAALRSLFSRALDAASNGIIADAALPAHPIIANAGFVRLTGYPRDAIIGRNCHFYRP